MMNTIFFNQIYIYSTGWPLCLAASNWLSAADNIEQLTQAAGCLWPPLGWLTKVGRAGLS